MSATRPHERSAACGPPTRNSARYCPPIAATLTPNERGRVDIAQRLREQFDSIRVAEIRTKEFLQHERRA